MKRKIHVFDNGVMVFDDHLMPLQRERYKLRNVHEAEEEDIFAEIIRAIPPNGCYVNIGSAIGYYPLLAKRMAPGLVIYAIEPLEHHRDLFVENIVLNGLRQSDFTIYKEGISTSDGEAEFLEDGYESTIHRNSDDKARSVKFTTKMIRTKTLDNMLSTIGQPVELCQMDIQGLELEVLIGAQHVLQDGSIKTFLIGTHSRQLHQDCIELLMSKGYAIEFEEFDTKIQPDGIIVASKGVYRLIKSDETNISFTSGMRCSLIQLQGVSEFIDRSEERLTLTAPSKIVDTNFTFSPESYAYYQDLSRACIEKITPPFILLDSKSLPRSGLHYMKKTFATLLGDNFSFCEWYQEPGCCKKMPCALTGYADKSKKERISRLRLVKSHDFDLTDPIFKPLYSLRRLILVRDPLFLLTSSFTLEQLVRHKEKLQKSGINLDKIWFSHEPEVLASAYQIIDEEFIAPDIETLTVWLEEKTKYILGFLDKWVRPALERPQSYLQVVRYEEINAFIVAILNELYDYLPEGAKNRINAFIHQNAHHFQARHDPFQAPSDKLASFMSDNTYAFQKAANKILAAAPDEIAGISNNYSSKIS